MRLVSFLVFTFFAAAQTPRFAGHIPTRSDYVIMQNLNYTGALKMDLYTPARRSSDRLPVLILFNGFGGHESRTTSQFESWAKAATTHGFASVVEDTTADHTDVDLDSLLAYLRKQAPRLRINTQQIALMAWSGHAGVVWPLIEDSRRDALKAAVIYYAGGDVTEFRLDLPVLLVRAGLDQPTVNQSIDRLCAAGLAANAPWTILNDPASHHGFEMVDFNATSRDIIDKTFGFLRSSLSPEYQAAIAAGQPEAHAAAALTRSDFAEAVKLYASLAEQHSGDFRILLSYGNALFGAGQYRDALTQFERVRAIGGAGPRDVGLPAARAAALAHDPDAAIAWLQSIPSRGMPASVQNEAVFEALRDRVDFQAIFKRK